MSEKNKSSQDVYEAYVFMMLTLAAHTKRQSHIKVMCIVSEFETRRAAKARVSKEARSYISLFFLYPQSQLLVSPLQWYT